MVIAALVLGLILLLVPPAGAADQPAAALIEAQTRLVESTREYRASLEPVLGLQETEVERAEAQARRRRELFERDLVSRREADESEGVAAAARARVAETRQRMAEADALMSETLAAIELAKMPKAARMELVTTDAVIRYQGTAGVLGESAQSLEAFFARRFGRALPVSARGQTALHDRLGLDHRRALDVALNPDSEEGRALIEYLRVHHIAFLAFRGPVPGASTGAHIHVGELSPRLAPVRTIAR